MDLEHGRRFLFSDADQNLFGSTSDYSFDIKNEEEWS